MSDDQRPPRTPRLFSRRVGAPAVVVSAVALAALTARVALAGDVPGDPAVVRALAVAPAGPWHDVAMVVDRLTDTAMLVGVAVGAAAALIVLTRRLPAGVLVAAGTPAAVLLTAILKRVVERPRPDLLTVAAHDLSRHGYPSGHASGTAALALSAVLVGLGTRWVRHVAVAASALVAVAAWSQLALAAHHPSDLVGGWLVASACVGVAWWATSRRDVRARQGSNLRPSA